MTIMIGVVLSRHLCRSAHPSGALQRRRKNGSDDQLVAHESLWLGFLEGSLKGPSFAMVRAANLDERI